MKSIILTTLVITSAFAVNAQEPKNTALVEGVESNSDLSFESITAEETQPSTADVEDRSSDGENQDAPEELSDSITVDGVNPISEDIDMSPPNQKAGAFAEISKSLRVSLKHEVSYKFQSPKRLVNNRSSVRLEYSKLFAEKLFFILDTKINLNWSNDHRAEAKKETLFRELVTREAYLQTSFGNTSLRVGYQILPWGVSEGGAITDEVSPRNASEFFFVSLEESRIGQPMIIVDKFSNFGDWTAFFVPRPAYNKYPDIGSEYDIPGAFTVPKPKDHWSDSSDFEYGLRWKRTFGKSDISIMVASLIDNDYLVRKQRFSMYGLTANIGTGNLLYKAEIALKKPKVFFSSQTSLAPTTIVERDQLDASVGFDYSPGGRSLTYGAEFIRSHVLDWNDSILGREKDSDSIVASVSNQFLNNDLTLTWLGIYNIPYTSYQHKFLSLYKIDDNATVYFELFYPLERDRRSGSYDYRDQKQVVLRYQYQF